MRPVDLTVLLAFLALPGVNGCGSSTAASRCSQVRGAGFCSRRRDLLSMLIKDRHGTRRRNDNVGASLLAALVAAILLAAVARRFDVSAPLALVVAGLAGGALPASTTFTWIPIWCSS